MDEAIEGLGAFDEPLPDAPGDRMKYSACWIHSAPLRPSRSAAGNTLDS
jgi:hypothetical protein